MQLRLNERILARKLRKQGLSFSEIIERIPNLSKSTLNGWLKDIELTLEQKERLLAKVKNGADRGRLKGAFKNHQKRIQITEQIVGGAKSEAKEMITNPLFLTGVMLYWAEGRKTDEEIGFTNSDPLMIKFMMNWFREICNVPETKFRIALNIITLHNKKETEKFWSEITEVPLSQFNKTIVKPTPLKGKRNPSYMGTCNIRMSNKNLFRKIMGWKLGVLENFKISPHSSIG